MTWLENQPKFPRRSHHAQDANVEDQLGSRNQGME